MSMPLKHPPPPPPPPALQNLQILLTTESGRPIYHFTPTSPNPALSITLSATLAAFIGKVENSVRTISTPEQDLFLHANPPFLLAISAPLGTHAKPLAKITLTTVFATLSASVIPHLTQYPSADTKPLSARCELLLNRVITSTLAHPLPAGLGKPPLLPAPYDPTSRPSLVDAIRQLLRQSKQVSHVLILTTSRPRYIITCVSPSNEQLTPLDLLLLLQLPPDRLHPKSVFRDTLFLPTSGFRKGFQVGLRAVKLRLENESLRMYRSDDEGVTWKKEFGNEKILWLMLLGSWDDDRTKEKFFDLLETSLDRTSAARDIMVALQRPWTSSDVCQKQTLTVSDIGVGEGFNRFVKAVMMIGEDRFVATIDAFECRVTEAVLKTLDLSSDFFISYSMNGLLVIVCERSYIVVFEDVITEDDGVRAAKRVFVPWLKKFKSSLMPTHTGTVIHPSTPLAGFLAPFSS